MGQRVIRRLLDGGAKVHSLVRPGSGLSQLDPQLRSKVTIVTGNALDHETYWREVPEGSVFVHLVGTPHPAPWKADQFEQVDYVSLRESVEAAKKARAARLVYVSVAHPAPVMRSYIAVRVRCEGLIRESGLPATILRPWYVLGPGHWWPVILRPLYWLARRNPSAQRLGLVTLDQMTAALAKVTLYGRGSGLAVLDVPAIRAMEPATVE